MERDGEVEEAEPANAGIRVDFPGFVALKRHEEKQVVSDCAMRAEKKTSRGGTRGRTGKEET